MWRAADETLDRQVAVKEMRIDGLDAEDTRTRRERTLREARATARIDHPNVVRVYDVVDEGERLWIVMELVAGRSLERMLTDDGALGPREVARIGLGLVAALRQVHAGGVLHRDIKPGNVLVENGGRRVVLTDFGIAAIQDATALTVVGMLVGSPDYMAPERISGRPQGPPSDIWSLGATLCAALGGRSPFSRDTTLATLHAVLYEEPELPAAAGPLREILAALLEKEPSDRPGLAEAERALTRVAFPAEGAESAEGPQVPQVPGELAAPETELEPESPPEVYRESPTPVFLAPSLVRAARDPRVYDPHPVEDAIPTQRPAVEEPVSAAEAVSEAVSEAASELSSEASPSRADQGERTEPAAPAEPSADPQLAARAQALTERKPAPLPAHPPAPRPAPPHPAPQRPDLGPHPARVPRGGELPGPARPFTGPCAPPPPHPPPYRTDRRRGRSGRGRGHRHDPRELRWLVRHFSGWFIDVNGTVRLLVRGDVPPPQPLPPPRPPPSKAPHAPDSPARHASRGGRFRVGDAGGMAAGSEDRRRGALHVTGRESGARRQVGARAGDLMETWEASERNAQQGQDYRKIRLDRTTFRGFPAVSWEYTFTLKGVAWHARLLGFDEDGKSYQINTWYQPDVETQALETYDKVKDSFVVL